MKEETESCRRSRLRRIFFEGVLQLVTTFRRAQARCACVDTQVGARDLDGLLRDASNVFRRDAAARREAPRAFEQHANAKAEILSARNILHLPLARVDRLAAITVDADVGVGDAEFALCAQSDIEALLSTSAAAASSATTTLLIHDRRRQRNRAGSIPGRLDKVTTRGGHITSLVGWIWNGGKI